MLATARRRTKGITERLEKRWRASSRVKNNAFQYAWVALFVGYILVFIGIIVLLVWAFRWFLLAYCAWLMVLGQQTVLRELGFLGSGHE